MDMAVVEHSINEKTRQSLVGAILSIESSYRYFAFMILKQICFLMDDILLHQYPWKDT